MRKELVKPTRGRQEPTQNTMKCSWRKLQSLATKPGCSSLVRRTEGSHRLVPHPCRRSASGARHRRHLRPRMRSALSFGLACGISLNYAHALHKPKANDVKKTQCELGRTTVDDFSVFVDHLHVDSTTQSRNVNTHTHMRTSVALAPWSCAMWIRAMSRELAGAPCFSCISRSSAGMLTICCSML